MHLVEQRQSIYSGTTDWEDVGVRLGRVGARVWPVGIVYAIPIRGLVNLRSTEHRVAALLHRERPHRLEDRSPRSSKR